MKKINILKTEIKIGLSSPVRILHATDSHIARVSEYDIAKNPELKEHARERSEAFGGDKQLEEYFEAILDYAKSENIPLLHTGDLYDFLSTSNLEYIERTLSSVDSIYVAGNHDFCHFVGRAIEDYQYKWENLLLVQPHVKQNLYFDSRIVGGINIVSLDNSYYLFTKGQEEMLRAEAAKGYPIILCMHVPLYAPQLAKRVLECNPCAYVVGAPREMYCKYPNDRRLQQNPDKATLDMIEYIKSEPKIRAIVAGHVHRDHIEPLDNGILQICSPATYDGYARELIIT